jgi:hypothetical protein
MFHFIVENRITTHHMKIGNQILLQAMPGYIIFKFSPLENVDGLKIMSGQIVCTNETTLVPRVEDANSSSDGHEEDVITAAKNSTPDPSTAMKRKRKVYHDSLKPRKKKEQRDDYMRRIVDAFEAMTFSSNKTISSMRRTRCARRLQLN